MARSYEKQPFRFSLKALLIVVTLAALLSATLTSHTGRVVLFLIAYSLSVSMICLGVIQTLRLGVFSRFAAIILVLSTILLLVRFALLQPN